MKLDDLFPGIKDPRAAKSKLLIANRAPTSADPVKHEWWYDRSQKVMYRATEKGYIKD